MDRLRIYFKIPNGIAPEPANPVDEDEVIENSADASRYTLPLKIREIQGAILGTILSGVLSLSKIKNRKDVFLCAVL